MSIVFEGLAGYAPGLCSWLFLEHCASAYDSFDMDFPSETERGIIRRYRCSLSMMLWTIFRESFMSPILSAQKSQVILTKVNFPRESIIFSGFYMTLFNSAIKLAIIAAVFVVFRIIPSWTIILGIFGIIAKATWQD